MDADLTPILEDLAAGRIDAVEANRRIGLAHELAAQQTARVEAERAERERRAAEEELRRTLDDAQRVTDPPRTGTDPGAGAHQTSSGTRTGGRSPWADLAKGLADAAGDLAGAAGGIAGQAVRTAATQAREQMANARTQQVPHVPTASRPSGSQGVERLVVRATGRQVRIVADPNIGTVAVDGPHRRERHEGVLEVVSESELGAGAGIGARLKAFGVTDAPRLLRGELGGGDLARLVTGKPVVVRVNPAIVVEVETSGGSLHVEGVSWLSRVRVTAGTATFTGVGEVEDALVQAATVTFAGRFDGPRSRVRVESGRVRVDLDDHADVTVVGTASVGRIVWPVPGQTEHRAGLGTGRLDLSVSLGEARVTDARA